LTVENFLTAARPWLCRREGSYGRGARGLTSILLSGATLQLDPECVIIKSLSQTCFPYLKEFISITNILRHLEL
jgi:hypothetical protein